MILALLGVAGGLIPIFQGWVFLLLAVAVMDIERKRVWVRWALTRTFLRKVGGAALYRRVYQCGKVKGEAEGNGCGGTPAADAEPGSKGDPAP